MPNEEAADPFISGILKDALTLEGKSPVSTPKQEAAQEKYAHYYNRIYPVLKELDFQQVSIKTGFKERRIRETLLFRMGAGEIELLVGRQEGFCYICGCRNRSLATQEPICLECLQILDAVIHQMHPVPDPSFKGIPYTEAPWGLALAELNRTDDTPDVVPRGEHEAVLAQLKQYQSKYGPLESAAQAFDEAIPAELALVDANPAAFQETPEQQPDLPEPEEKPIEDQADSLLVLLAMDDRDVPGETVLLPETLSNEPLRHFGFQRLKGTG